MAYVKTLFLRVTLIRLRNKESYSLSVIVFIINDVLILCEIRELVTSLIEVIHHICYSVTY